MHPSQLPLDQFEQQCRWVFSRASGPGGQHRNKVETAATIEHLPSGTRASASEERSQIRNRQVALHRLRMLLALQTDESGAGGCVSELWSRYCRSGKIRVAIENEHFPALLAEVFEVLSAKDFHLAQAADHFGTTATQLVRFLGSYPPALVKLNEQLVARGLSPRTTK